jgi:hypothetical protein
MFHGEIRKMNPQWRSAMSSLPAMPQGDQKVLELIAKIKTKTDAGKLSWRSFQSGIFTAIKAPNGATLMPMFFVTAAPERTWSSFQVKMGKDLILKIDRTREPLLAILGKTAAQGMLDDLFSTATGKQNPLDAAIKAIDLI